MRELPARIQWDRENTSTVGKRRATSTSQKQSLSPGPGDEASFLWSALPGPSSYVFPPSSHSLLESPRQSRVGVGQVLVRVSPRKLSNSSVPMGATNRHPGRCASRLRQVWRAAGISILSGCGVGTRGPESRRVLLRLAWPRIWNDGHAYFAHPLQRSERYYRTPPRLPGRV